jgi:two-component system, cell cycle sensor histidine kinase and response regulator CckA
MKSVSEMDRLVLERARELQASNEARRQGDQTLAELQYKEIFDNFSQCVFVLDVTPDGRFKIAALNPAEERATGLSSAEAAGKFIEDVLPEAVAARVITHYRSCVEAGAVIHYDEELNMPIGARYFHTNLIPVRNESGRIHRLVGCCMDFTDLKRSQEEAFARQNLESVGTLASGIAHDFNNILGAVLAQAEVALAELAAGVEPEEELNEIRKVSIHGSEIVRQLMTYAGHESEVVGLVDVSRIVEDMLALLKISISKHAVLEIDLGQNLPAVKANSAQVRQILMNLVTNASEAIGNLDGVIRVTTGRTTLRRDAGSSKGVAGGEYLQLQVSDTGRGMTLETQSRVFDPFYTTKSAGRGLGLAVVHGIVRRLGGTIGVVSEPGKGATFQVLLPCAKAFAAKTVSASRQPALAAQKLVTLVVEDEHPLRQAIVKMLRKKGFDVIEAATGSAAIDLLRANGRAIDVILLDMTIPGASSHEVVAEAARLQPNSKVILTSAYSREMVASGLSAPQIRGFIRKPFRLADLVRTLQDSVVG